jgi:hypothetical protein
MGDGLKRAKKAAKATRAKPVKAPEHLGTARPGYTMQVCSRCDGSAVDPEMPDCTCDVCGGTGEEEIPVDYKA